MHVTVGMILCLLPCGSWKGGRSCCVWSVPRCAHFSRLLSPTARAPARYAFRRFGFPRSDNTGFGHLGCYVCPTRQIQSHWLPTGRVTKTRAVVAVCAIRRDKHSEEAASPSNTHACLNNELQGPVAAASLRLHATVPAT
jgi:hypothetical protein